MLLATLFTLVLLRQDEPDLIAVDRTEFHGKVVLPMLPSPRRAPLIELKIEGKAYHFMLDTGAVAGRISQAIVDRLGLKPEREVTAGDPSGKNSRQVKGYRIPEIDAGSARFFGVHMFADSGPDGGRLANGVIGYGVFKDLLLTLDYPAKQVVLQEGSLDAAAIHYDTKGGIPFLPIEIGTFKVFGHVDSGSDGGLTVPLKYKDQLPLDGETTVIGHARTLFNEMTIYGARVKGPVKVGGMPIDVPLVELHDMFPVGNIGGRVLQHYRVTIDQKSQRIYFGKP